MKTLFVNLLADCLLATEILHAFWQRPVPGLSSLLLMLNRILNYLLFLKAAIATGIVFVESKITKYMGVGIR